MTEFQEYLIHVYNRPDLRFKGKLIASVTGELAKMNREVVERILGEWNELFLYRTEGGNFVCHRIEHCDANIPMRDEPRPDRHYALATSSTSEVTAFFGFSENAKQLYSEAGISIVVEVR